MIEEIVDLLDENKILIFKWSDFRDFGKPIFRESICVDYELPEIDVFGDCTVETLEKALDLILN